MKKVLVIIDMQNDFIDGPLGNDECKQAVPAVIDAVNNGCLLYTSDAADEL